MDHTFEEKCAAIKKILEPLPLEKRYQALMEMGRKLPPYPNELKTPDRLVPGCQSILYINATQKGNQIFFEAHADALISAGLAALLIAVYSGETPETVLKCPPMFIAELGLSASLSPSRSNGLANIHLRMKQEALKNLVSQN